MTMTNVTPANLVIDRQSEMNKLPEYEYIDYIKIWNLQADTVLYQRPFYVKCMEYIL